MAGDENEAAEEASPGFVDELLNKAAEAVRSGLDGLLELEEKSYRLDRNEAVEGEARENPQHSSGYDVQEACLEDVSSAGCPSVGHGAVQRGGREGL